MHLNIERLKECREAMGITRLEVSNRIRISQPAYVRYESGERSPAVPIIREIARVLGTSVAYLTGESDQKNPDFITIDKNDNPLLFSAVEQLKNCDDTQLERIMKYVDAAIPLNSKK